MMTLTQQKAHERAVVEIFEFMRKRGLSLEELIEIGGEDLKSSNPKKVEKAKRVEKCWSLMAKLGVKYADLENSPSNHPTKSVRRRRGEGHFLEVPEITDVSGISPVSTKSNEINDLANSVPVGDLDLNPETMS